MFNPENINILIVDDNTLVLKAYEGVLANCGYRILTATTGKQALQIIAQEEISLILLDVVLPDLSGLEIMRIIKSKPESEHIFVVLISSLATSSENQIEGMTLGADGYLVKPMPAWELVVRVNGFLKHMRTIELLKISEEKYRKISEKYREAQLELEVEERTSELVSLNNGLIREINERIKVEQELKKLSNVVEQAADHVLITNKEGIIEYVNPAFEAGTGYSKEEVIGLTPRILKSDSNYPDFYKNLWETVLSGQTYRGESINKKKNGSLYFESMTVTPLLDADNKITHLVSVGSDITLRRQAEADRIARESADQANKAKSLFLANMSHEIRTPMNAIIGFSDLLYAGMKDEKQRSQIDAIRSSGKNLLRIINDILDLSKIESGKMVIQHECTNIRVILKEIKTIFAHLTQEKGIELLINIPDEIPSALMLDETRIRQILFNLIGNAVKFTNKGSISLSVMKKVKGEDKIDLIIKVKDTGIGIPTDQQNLVFEAFTQQDGQRSAQYGGTGLGLTITRRLVEMMGGNITLNSEPGFGCLFTITLPDIVIFDVGDKEHPVNSFISSAPFFDKGSVLIADDNQENRHYLVDLLSRFPLTIYEAENGAVAIEKALLYLPEVILMDFKMPVMNGHEAIEKLKEQATTNKIPIIALSASSMEILEEQNGAGLFDDFLMKPIIASELLEILKKYLSFHLITESTRSESEYSPSSNSNLTLKQKDQLPRLITLLENEYIPVYADVAKKQVIGQIKTFGKQLNALGKDHSNPLVTDFGKELLTYANNFEISKMMKILLTFPEIINRLKKMM